MRTVEPAAEDAGGGSSSVGGRGPTGAASPRDEYPWAGIQTFFKVPYVEHTSDFGGNTFDVAIGGVPWDGLATGHVGARMGPRATRNCDYVSTGQALQHLEVGLEPFSELHVVDCGDAEIFIGDPDRTWTSIHKFVGGICESGAIPFIVGGDHSITWPAATAVADHFGHGRLGILHFDAHADTSPDMQGSLHGHGTPMRRLIESGAVPGRNFVQFGLRGYLPEAPVFKWMQERQMRSYRMGDIRRLGFEKALDVAIADTLQFADFLYLSLDIDVVDPAYAPGTGTPEPGGLTSQEILRAVRRVAAEVGIVAMDLVEVCPPMDTGPDITSLLARRCLMEALTGIAMRRKGLTSPDFYAPTLPYETDGPLNAND